MIKQGFCTGMTSFFLPGLEFALFFQSGNKFSPVLAQPALKTWTGIWAVASEEQEE